jgi:hypothetical protein
MMHITRAGWMGPQIDLVTTTAVLLECRWPDESAGRVGSRYSSLMMICLGIIICITNHEGRL